jgi:NDP-sugar pyrophosphorylase family protein
MVSRQAILMAGGKGMRLRPMSAVIPKPLAILGESSIIEIILYQLSCYGFDRVAILLGYKPEMVQAVVGDGSKWGIGIKCVLESEPLGTLGGLKLISEDLDEDFLVMNCDILTILNYKRMLEYHRLGSSIATIGSVRRMEAIQLGVLEVNEQAQIIDYREKPIYHFLATMGVNCFNKRILKYIPAGKNFGLDDLLFSLLEAKEQIQSFIFSGLWMDIGRWDDFDKAQKMFTENPQVFLPASRISPEAIS